MNCKYGMQKVCPDPCDCTDEDITISPHLKETIESIRLPKMSDEDKLELINGGWLDG